MHELTRPAHIKISDNFGRVHNRTKGNKNFREKEVIIQKGKAKKSFLSTADCAKWLGMNNNNVSMIFHRGVKYEGWTVTQIGEKKALVLQKKKLTTKEAREIKEQINKGVDLFEIAYNFKVSYNSIWMIKVGKSFTDA